MHLCMYSTVGTNPRPESLFISLLIYTYYIPTYTVVLRVDDATYILVYPLPLEEEQSISPNSIQPLEPDNSCTLTGMSIYHLRQQNRDALRDCKKKKKKKILFFYFLTLSNQHLGTCIYSHIYTSLSLFQHALSSCITLLHRGGFKREKVIYSV